MKYDLAGARKAGVSDRDIADFLATQVRYDLAGARKAGVADSDIADLLAKELGPKARHPFKAGMEAARSQLTEGLPYALEKTFGEITPEEQAAYSAKLQASNARQEELLPGGPAALGKDNLLSVIGENLAYSSPQMAAALGAGAIGTLAGPEGTLAGLATPLIAGTAASTPFFVGSNVDRATSGGEEALTKDEAGRALLAAPAQAAVDTVSDRFIPGVGRLLGAPAKKTVGKILQRTATGALKGAASEGIAEPLQQVGERWAAGEALTDEDALREYGQAAATAAVLGGTMGGVGAHFERAGEPHVRTNPEDQGELPGGDANQQYPGGEAREAPVVTEEEFNQAVESLVDQGMPRDDAMVMVARAAGLPITPEGANVAGSPVAGGSEPSVPSPAGGSAGVGPAGEPAEIASEGLGAIVEPASGPVQREVPVQPALTEEPADEEVIGERDFSDWAPTAEELGEVEEPRAPAIAQGAIPNIPGDARRNFINQNRWKKEEAALNEGFAFATTPEVGSPPTLPSVQTLDPQITASAPVVDTTVDATPEIVPVKAKKQRLTPVSAPVQGVVEEVKTPQIQKVKPAAGGFTVELDTGETFPLTVVRDKKKVFYQLDGTDVNPKGDRLKPIDAAMQALPMWAERQNPQAEEAAQGPEFEAPTAEKLAAKPKRTKDVMGTYEEIMPDGTKVTVKQIRSNVAKGAYKGATSAKLYNPTARVEEVEELTPENEQQQAVSAKINKAFADNRISQNEMSQLRNRMRMPDSGEKQISLSRLGEETRAMFADPYKDTATPGSGWHPQRVSEELDRLLASPRRNRNAPDISVISGQTQFEETSPAAPKSRTSVEGIKTVNDAIKRGKLGPVLKAVSTSETVKPHLTALASKLDAGGVGDVNISVKDYGDRALRVLGTSDLTTGDVILNKTSNGVSGDTLETLLHEAIHSFVAKRYHTIGKYLDSNKKRTGTGEQAADPFIKEFQDLWGKLHDVIVANPKLLAKAKEEVWLREAANSPDELLTRIFTDENLRDFLKTIDIDGKPIVAKKPTPAPAPAPSKSFWDHIVDAFAKLFGITKPNERAALEEVLDSGTPRSAFDEVLESGDRLITAAAQDKPTGEYTKKLIEVAGAGQKGVQNARAPGRPNRTGPARYITTASSNPNTPPVPPSGLKSAVAKAPKSTKSMLNSWKNAVIEKLNYSYQGGVVADEYLAANAPNLSPNVRLDKGFEMFNARATGRKAELMRKFINPINDLIIRLGLDPQDVNMYLWARAAPGRNAVIDRRNGTTGSNGSGLSDADAKFIRDEYARRGMQAKLDQVAALHDELVKFRLNTLVDGGLLTRAEATALLAANPYYTPMKGIALEGDINEEGEYDAEDAGNKQAYYGSRTREFMTAKGRESMPRMPLQTLMEDAASAIMRAERNKVGQALWDVYEQAGLAADHLVSTYSYRPMLGKKEFHAVKRNGKTKYFVFKGTEEGEALKRAFENLNPGEVNGFLKYWTNTANVLKRLMTTWNPAFLGTAAFRDIMDAVASSKTAETDPKSPAYGKDLYNQTIPFINREVFNGVWSYVTERAPRTAAEARLHAVLDNMIAEGGGVGSAMLHGKDAFLGDLKGKLKEAAALQAKSPTAHLKKTLRLIGESMDNTAHAFDLFPRLATYMGALNTGLTPRDAANVSLNSSLNLTRRGEWSRFMDNTFFFFSPTVEGARKFKNMALTSKNGMKLMAGFAALGAATTVMNSIVAGGDDDEDGRPNFMDVPKVTRQTRLVIYYGPKSNDYFTVPMGFMLAYPVYMGGRATEAVLGISQGESAAVMMADAAKDLTLGLANSVSPLRPQGEQVQESVASLSPSMTKPLTDLAVNKNFFGSAIYNKQYDSRIARSTLGRESTGDVWKWIAKSLNDVSGGVGNSSGFVDFQPEQYRYLFEAYAGGPYRIAKDITKIGDPNSSDTGLAKVPLIRGFVGKGSEYVPMNEYYKHTRKLASLEYAERNQDEDTLEAMRKKNPVDADPRVLDAYVGAEKELARLGRFRLDELRNNESPAERKSIIKDYRELNQDIFKDFNKTYNEVRKEIQNSEG